MIPVNPATIADNVGDNVGDVAGMGADLFGSYVATVLAAMVLGNYVIRDMSAVTQFTDLFNNMGPILLPLVIAGVGVLASIIGTFFVRIGSNDAREGKVQRALDIGNWFAILLTLVASWFLIQWMLPDTIDMTFLWRRNHNNSIHSSVCLLCDWLSRWCFDFFCNRTLHQFG